MNQRGAGATSAITLLIVAVLGLVGCADDSSSVESAYETSTTIASGDASSAMTTIPGPAGPADTATGAPAGASTTVPGGVTAGGAARGGAGSATPGASTTANGPPASPAAGGSSSNTTTTFFVPDNAAGATDGGTFNGATNPNNGGLPEGGLPVGGTPLLPPNPGDSKNCSDFATYASAKQWFDYYRPAYGDVANLDPDRNLIPCPELPGAPAGG